MLAGEVDCETPKDTQMQSPTTVTVSSCYDIGEIVSLGGLEKLSSHEKYSILKSHFKPYKTYIFSKVHLYGCQRSCKIEYLHSSFVYSKKEDAVYCINCALFLPTNKRRALGSFVNNGYKGWNNIHEKQTLHIGNKYHDDATKEASGIITKFEEPNNTTPHQNSDTLKERQKTYPNIVEALARIIHLIGKQGIAYRGTEEKADDSNTSGNPGYFLAIVREIANYYPLLHEHIFAPLRKDVLYMSPTSQNELIEIIGKSIIQKRFIEEIKGAQYHSVLADEVTSSNDEILSICMRYVNKEKQIREVFLDFLSLERITGECIGQTILKFYEEKGINILDYRGQCYDGAPNMQSLKKGAASYILKESPKAYTTHCCLHSLNLSLASTCKITIITNVVEIYKSVLIYFNTSPKRENLLIHIFE